MTTKANEIEEDKKKKNLEIIKKIIKENKYEYIDEIGYGGFGVVSEVKKDGKHFAMKIVMNPNNNEQLKTELVNEFRGKNIVKIILEKKFIKERKEQKEGEQNYYLYIMERSNIGDLDNFNKFLYTYLIFKEPFIEKVGDNLIRFLAQQLVIALKTLCLGNLVHLDIKPSNILIFKDLTLKLIDFSLLRKVNKENNEKIPEGTFGFCTPESYSDKEFNIEDLRKQDYYAIGMTIYFLKYTKSEVENYKREKQGTSTDKNLDLNITTRAIEDAFENIQHQEHQDKDFTEFLCNLIQFKPEGRLNFEQIIRNKWLNKNKKEIKKINNINESNENNLILELQKSDFLINNRKYYRKNFNERYGNENDNKKYKKIKKGKFKFGKKN